MALSVSGFPDRHGEDPQSSNPSSSASSPSPANSPPSSSSIALNSPLLRGLFSSNNTTTSNNNNNNNHNTHIPSNNARRAPETKSPPRSDSSESELYQYHYHSQHLHTSTNQNLHLNSIGGGALNTPPPTSPPDTSSTFPSSPPPLSSSPSGINYENDHLHKLQIRLPIPDSLDPPRAFVHPHQLPSGSVKRPQPLPGLPKPISLSTGLPMPMSLPSSSQVTQNAHHGGVGAPSKRRAASPVRLQSSLVRLEIGKGHGIGHGGQGQSHHATSKSVSYASSSTTPTTHKLPSAVTTQEWNAAPANNGVECSIGRTGDGSTSRPLPNVPPSPPSSLPSLLPQAAVVPASSSSAGLADRFVQVQSAVAASATSSYPSPSPSSHPHIPIPLPTPSPARSSSNSSGVMHFSSLPSLTSTSKAQDQLRQNTSAGPSRPTFPSSLPSPSISSSPFPSSSSSSKPHHQRIPSSKIYLSAPSETRAGHTPGVNHPHGPFSHTHVQTSSLSMRFKPVSPASHAADGDNSLSSNPAEGTEARSSEDKDLLVTPDVHIRPLPKIPSLTSLNTFTSFSGPSASNAGIASSSSNTIKSSSSSSSSNRFIPPPARVRRPRTSPTPSTTSSSRNNLDTSISLVSSTNGGINAGATAARATFPMWAARPIDLNPAPGQPPPLVQSSFPATTSSSGDVVDTTSFPSTSNLPSASASSSIAVVDTDVVKSSLLSSHPHPLLTPPIPLSASHLHISHAPARSPPLAVLSQPPRPPSRQAIQHQKRQEQKRRERERTRTISQGQLSRSQPHSRSGSVSSGANVPFLLNPAKLAATSPSGIRHTIGVVVAPSQRGGVQQGRREHSADSFLESHRSSPYSNCTAIRIPPERTRSTSRTRGQPSWTKVSSSSSPMPKPSGNVILGRPRGETVPSPKTSPTSGSTTVTPFLRPRPTLNTTFNLTGSSSPQPSPKPTGGRSPNVSSRLSVISRPRTRSAATSPTTHNNNGVSPPTSPTPTTTTDTRPFRALPSPTATTPIASRPLPHRAATVDTLPLSTPVPSSDTGSAPQSPRQPLSIQTSPVVLPKAPKAVRALPTPTAVSSMASWSFRHGAVSGNNSEFSTMEDETRALDVSAPLHYHPVAAFTDTDVEDADEEDEEHAISPIVVGNSTFNDVNEPASSQNKNGKSSRASSPYRDPFSDSEDEDDDDQRYLHHAMNYFSSESRSPSPIRYARPDSRGNLSPSSSNPGKSTSPSSLSSVDSSAFSTRRRRAREQLRSFRNSYRLQQIPAEISAFPMTSSSNLGYEERQERSSGASVGSGSAPVTRHSSPHRGDRSVRGGGEVEEERQGRSRKKRGLAEAMSRAFEFDFEVKKDKKEDKPKKEKDKEVDAESVLKKKLKAKGGGVPPLADATGGVFSPSPSTSAEAFVLDISLSQLLSKKKADKLKSSSSRPGTASSSGSGSLGGGLIKGGGDSGGFAPFMWVSRNRPVGQGIYDSPSGSPSPLPKVDVDTNPSKLTKRGGTFFVPATNGADLEDVGYLSSQSNRSLHLEDHFDDIVDRKAYGSACGLGLLRGTSPTPPGLTGAKSRKASRARAVTTIGPSFRKQGAVSAAGVQTRSRSLRRKSKKRTASVPTIPFEEMPGALMEEGKELGSVIMHRDVASGGVRIKRNEGERMMADEVYDSDAALLSVTMRRDAADEWDYRRK